MAVLVGLAFSLVLGCQCARFTLGFPLILATSWGMLTLAVQADLGSIATYRLVFVLVGLVAICQMQRELSYAMRVLTLSDPCINRLRKCGDFLFSIYVVSAASCVASAYDYFSPASLSIATSLFDVALGPGAAFLFTKTGVAASRGRERLLGPLPPTAGLDQADDAHY